MKNKLDLLIDENLLDKDLYNFIENNILPNVNNINVKNLFYYILNQTLFFNI